VRTRLSICVRKVRYRSANDALAAAAAAGLALRPYRCDRCGQFHLTSRRKGKWQPLTAADARTPVDEGDPGRSTMRDNPDWG